MQTTDLHGQQQDDREQGNGRGEKLVHVEEVGRDVAES
jgi:hypothetical protein